MIRRIALAALLALTATVAFAQQQSPDPAQAALGQMVGECQNREAQALVQVYALRAQLAAATKRADEAEAKLKGTEKPTELTK